MHTSHVKEHVDDSHDIVRAEREYIEREPEEQQYAAHRDAQEDVSNGCPPGFHNVLLLPLFRRHITVPVRSVWCR